MTLKELRLKAGQTLADVADALDVDEATISKWERGVMIPGGTNMLQLQEWAEKLRKELGAGKVKWPWE